MDYPGRIIRLGENDKTVLKAIAERLRQRGYAAPAAPATFDATMKSLVKLLQTQHSDLSGRPLKDDGEIGPITWGALFGKPVGAAGPAPTGGVGALAREALKVAITQIGVMEQPEGSNRGPEVDLYLKTAGVDPGNFWSLMQDRVDVWRDVGNGIVKSTVFGVICTAVALYQGHETHASPEGVAYATTRTVVISSLSVLGTDFILTALMFSTP